MQKHIVLCAALIACGVAGVGTAQAQYAPGDPARSIYGPGLRPFQIMQIVRSRGLTPLSRPMRRGPAYVVIAVDRGGGQVRLVLDAMRGEIVGIHPLLAGGAPAGYGRPPGVIPGSPAEAQVGPVPGAAQMPPPRVPPLNARVATAPVTAPMATAPATAAVVSSAAPARTPVPRPRPAAVASEQSVAASAAQPAVAAPEPAAAPVASPPAAMAKPAELPKHELHLVPVAPLDE